MITLRQVAHLAGVSVTTASYALNEKNAAKLRPETRLRVMAAAKELGYHPNLAGRLLQGGSSHTIGMLECQQTVTLYSGLPHLISQDLYKRGYKTIYRIAELQEGNSSAEEAAVDELIASGVDGIIISYLDEYPNFPREKCSVPMIQVDGRTPDINVNLELGGYLAAKHLLGHGHTRIAYIKSDSKYNQRKVKGYLKALQEADIKPHPEWILSLLETPSWQDEIKRLIYVEKITAICCQNDEFAAIFMKYLISQNLRVPEDIALFGFDGLGFVDWLPVSLSTVVQPIGELVKQIGQLITHKIANHITTFSGELLQVDPKLHLGHSCNCQIPQYQHVNWRETYPFIQ